MREWGGDQTARGSNGQILKDVRNQLKSGVKRIFSTEKTFAALKDDGSVVTWGFAGSSSSAIANELKSGVIDIFSDGYYFTAYKNDGSVVSWGQNLPISEVYSIKATRPVGLGKGILQSFSGAVLRTDGSAEFNMHTLTTINTEIIQVSDIKKIFQGAGSILAVKNDGSVLAFGRDDLDLILPQLNDITQVVNTGEKASAFLNKDGTVITWGDSKYGGHSQSVDFGDGVKELVANSYSMAAIKKDGSIVTWGDRDNGGSLTYWTEIDETHGSSIYGDPEIREKSNNGAIGFATPFFDNTLSTRSIGSTIYELDNIPIIDEIDNVVNTITATYSDNSFDYTFYNLGNYRYALKPKTDDEIDEITGVVILKFNDKDLTIVDDISPTFDQVTGLNTDSGEMFRLYNAAFARFPDADGLKYWIDEFSSGRNTRRVVAQSFLGSAEFTEKYGSNVSDETYVNNLYKNVLGRDADTEGLNYWVGNLSSGLETRYEALLGFAESAENKALFTEMTGFG